MSENDPQTEVYRLQEELTRARNIAESWELEAHQRFEKAKVLQQRYDALTSVARDLEHTLRRIKASLQASQSDAVLNIGLIDGALKQSKGYIHGT